ncbi:MAG: hypothetical protein HRU38_04975 [Saccharospirillaceae bacterium]|nr:hypothetical protein [Saccharospirillaceae bacterium]
MDAQDKGLSIDLYIDNNCDQYLIGDLVRYSQILSILVNNAIKFTENGKIEIALNSETTSNKILNSVLEYGIGITPEQQNKLFTNFTQADDSTSRKFGGTGLGLSICKYLVEIMGGEINVCSVLGSSSTFTFSLDLESVSESNVVVDKHDPINTMTL